MAADDNSGSLFNGDSYAEIQARLTAAGYDPAAFTSTLAQTPEEKAAYTQSLKESQKAQSDKQAATGVGAGTGAAAGITTAVGGPYGAIAGAAIAAGGAITSGVLEAEASKQQKKAAADLRKSAATMQAVKLAPGFQQKTSADELASTADKPGLEESKNALMQNFVAHMRAIRESSPTGGHAVNAISNSLGIENETLSKLMGDNADFKSKEAQKFRDDLWNMGLVQHQAIQENYENYQKPAFQQATALENAATANKQTAVNTIGGAVGAAGTNVVNAFEKKANYDALMKYYAAINGGKSDNAGFSGVKFGGSGGISSQNPYDYTMSKVPDYTGKLPKPGGSVEPGTGGIVGNNGFNTFLTWQDMLKMQNENDAPASASFGAPSGSVANTSGGSGADNLWNYNSYFSTTPATPSAL